MKTLNKYLLAAAVITMMAVGACTDGNNEQTAENRDSVTQKTDSVPSNGDMLFRGIAVDGSKRNIFIQVDDTTTLNFELPPGGDFTWEVGDSISIYVVQSSTGEDSITSMENLSQELES